MRAQPEIHWAEGMFLRPQHLQFFSRQVASQTADCRRQVLPFYWGLTAAEIAEEQLEAGQFSVRQLSGVLKDGTFIQLPGNLSLNPRDFLDKLDANGGRLKVYVGVPLLREGEPNTKLATDDGDTKDLRFDVEIVETSDENVGGAPRQIEVRKLNGRVFFDGEDREGYECLPLAELKREGAGRNLPVVTDTFVPPVLDVTAWPSLQKLAQTIVHKVEAKYRFLRAEIADERIVLDHQATGGWQPVLKLQIVGSFLHVLRQLTALPGIHPFQLYLEFSRLAGELSIFEESGAEAIEVPAYDHDRLGECYRSLVYTLDRLLDKILAGQFIRVDFKPEGDHLLATMQTSWLSGRSEVYLCIESELTDRELSRRLLTVKVAGRDKLEEATRRRLFGLTVEPLQRAPSGLPGRRDYHYFAVTQEGPYWQSVVNNSEVAVSGGIDPKLRFVMYIIEAPQAPPVSGTA